MEFFHVLIEVVEAALKSYTVSPSKFSEFFMFCKKKPYIHENGMKNFPADSTRVCSS